MSCCAWQQSWEQGAGALGATGVPHKVRASGDLPEGLQDVCLCTFVCVFYPPGQNQRLCGPAQIKLTIHSYASAVASNRRHLLTHATHVCRQGGHHGHGLVLHIRELLERA